MIKHISFMIGEDGKLTKIDKLPEGVQRIHLYNFDNLLRPRGSMQKESIGVSLYEKFVREYEYWTDPNYGDRRPPEEVVQKIRENVMEELEQAFIKFLQDIK
jgi:hypothetical protein